MKILFQLLLISIPFVSFSQDNKLAIFDNLIGKIWKAEGKWGNGSPFKQEVSFNYALDKSIVIAESNGFVNKEQTKFGARNHGIRQYSETCECIRFWEYDVFGGLTEGIVIQEGKSIIYQYEYGDSKVTDMWEYVDDNTYNFIVGDYSEGKWNQTYIKTKFKATQQGEKQKAFEMMKQHLNGTWSSPAWSGQLNEYWSEDGNGHIIQKAEYLEDGKVTYSAANKIEIVNGELILFTVIKDNSPKIFKASSYTENEVVFENSDYPNPSKVVYYFTDENSFERTISGIENGEPTSYTFTFTKQE